jgi:hypothetical protein
MIIHPAMVELLPTDVLMLRESGLPIGPADTHTAFSKIGRADLASHLRTARAHTDDPAQLSVIASFLRQLRA